MSTFEVTSELYSESDFATINTPNGNSVSRFAFVLPAEQNSKSGKCLNGKNREPDPDCNNEERAQYIDPITHNIECEHKSENDQSECLKCVPFKRKESLPQMDKDGDLVVERKQKDVIEIEHHKSTKLDLVGLQIWRGALLLADYIIYNEKKFKNRKILELGSGVGLTSVVSSFFAREVICTDINVGGLLDLIQSNVNRNSHLKNPDCNVTVTELDFKVRYEDYPSELKSTLQDVEYVIAADVIYDDDITEAFVLTLESLLLELPKLKAVYIALEKRYVFTVEDMDSVAPCYEHFLRVFHRRNNRFGITRWKLMQVPLTFPRYFIYEKVKELVLLKISN
ncbi:methyltransferase-like protein 22 [Toxorhynchites rutilus septentrionalis]|uniref:methyltransferase-like protein 22 n=1 Tax=Toxorhynchites rutilus septentrionalis TaxID=329112 RepID=UPI0024785C67|nr:methyltransferase-like protein 22 [Toxorhynchites rutilus septentrionalis]